MSGQRTGAQSLRGLVPLGAVHHWHLAIFGTGTRRSAAVYGGFLHGENHV